MSCVTHVRSSRGKSLRLQQSLNGTTHRELRSPIWLKFQLNSMYNYSANRSVARRVYRCAWLNCKHAIVLRASWNPTVSYPHGKCRIQITLCAITCGTNNKKRDKSSHFVPRTESFALRNRCPSGTDLIPPERIQNFNKRVTRSHVYSCITYSDLNQQQIDSCYNCTLNLTRITVKYLLCPRWTATAPLL